MAQHGVVFLSFQCGKRIKYDCTKYYRLDEIPGIAIVGAIGAMPLAHKNICTHTLGILQVHWDVKTSLFIYVWIYTLKLTGF